ncbi:MAG: hypothetical protein IKC83_04650 [Clostridia bacterium]|nr:hypothetical protein [Clostridia bacterium]
MANNLKVGFGRTNITPTMGIEIGGYYKVRLADGVLDDIEVNALALSDNKRTILMVTIDHCGLAREIMDDYKMQLVKKRACLLMLSIFMLRTHILRQKFNLIV